MPAFVKKARQDVNLASQDEIADQAIARSGASGTTRVPAIGEPFELHEMRRQGGRDIGLAFDRVHRIVFTAEHQGRTLDAAQGRGNMLNVSLSPPGLANQCSATSGRLTARRAISGSRGMRV